MERNTVAWAAGLFEGEGCISVHRNRGSALLYPAMDLAMTDSDVVARFFVAVGGLGSLSVRPGTNKRLYVWRANSFEVTQAVIAMLWPYLGVRRKAKAHEALTVSTASQAQRKTMRRGEECSMTDCADPVLARGLCSRHYQQARRVA